MAANLYQRAFDAQFSFVVLIVLAVVVVATYFIGRKSVKLVPRRASKRRTANYPANAPRYYKTKARLLAKTYKDFDRGFDNTAIICLRSSTFDTIVAAFGAAIFIWVFVEEHFLGLVQWCINNLTAHDSAAWGDITAVSIVLVLMTAVAALLFAIVRLGQIHQARALADKFVKERVRPIFNERRSFGFYVNAALYCINEDIKERQAKKANNNCGKHERARERV